MRFKVLGPLEVEGDDGPHAVVGHRPRALLTALLIQAGDVVAPERLVDAIWAESPPESPANALQQVVARLRARLGDGARHLVTEPAGYRLVLAAGDLDADEFEAGFRRARVLVDVAPEDALREIEAALALWRGPAYGEFAATFAQAPAVRLEELRTAAQEDRVGLLLRTAPPSDAVAAARELVGSAPLRDRPVELLMRALHASGRVAEALEAYRRHREQLADELGLDPPAGLRELEGRILRDDLPRPERPTTSRPPVTSTVRTHLPARLGGIIGREDDLEGLRRCLGDRRMVSLLGPGGVGKTRLALELAHELARGDTHVAWVDLSVVESGRLTDLVAEAVGVDMPRGGDPLSGLAASLHLSSVVLCLDNAETVLDEVALLVETLMEHAHQLRVLVTSRERLAVHSEHVHRLAPLPIPGGPELDNPAIRLFLERAGSLEAPTDAELADIAVLCRRLDGLPLAIELGAAQALTFGIRQFSDHIADEIDLLAGGRRTASTRHQTLRAVVDASYRLLTEEEAALFVRLVVFPAEFTLEDARSVCADDKLSTGLIGPLLARLADQSMLQSDAGRFWLLDTLRTYALERVDQGERVALHLRHARHVVDRVTGLSWQQKPEREEACIVALAQMTADLHAAWRYAVENDHRGICVELAAAVYDFAYQRQRIDLLDWGRQVAGWDIEHPDLAAALATGAAGAWASGDLDAAATLARRGMTVTDGEQRPRSSRSVSQAGNLAMFVGDFDEAIRLYELCIDLSLVEGRDITALLEEIAICQVMTYAGRRVEALQRLEDLTRRARVMKNPSAIAWAAFVTGEATGDADVATALAAYRTAIEECLKVDNRLFSALARSSAVALVARHGSAAEALSEFAHVVDEWDELGNVTAQWWVLMNLAILFARLGAHAPAARLAGAILGEEARTYALLGDELRLRETVRELTRRMGGDAAEAMLAQGRELTIGAGVALARETMAELSSSLAAPPSA